MKQAKSWKKRLTGGLSLALALGLLAGCGGNQVTENGENGTGGSPGGSSASNLASEENGFVYVPEFIEVRGDFMDGLQNATYSNGYLYARGTRRVQIERPDAESDEAQIEEDEAEADAQEVESDEIPEYDGGWNTETVIYKIGLDGSCEAIPYHTEETPEPKNDMEYYGNYLQDLRVTSDGMAYALEQSYHQWSEAPEGATPDSDPDYFKKYYKYEESMLLKRLNLSTGSQEIMDISAVREASVDTDYFYIQNFGVDAAGYVYLSTDSGIFILDKDGGLKNSITGSNFYIQSMMQAQDGRMLVLLYDNDNNESRIYYLDPESKDLGEGVKAAGDLYNMIPGGGDYDLYYTSGINFYGYKIETGEKEKILNWISCDVDPGYGISPIVLEDGRIVALLSNMNYGIVRRSAGTTIMQEEPSSTCELVILTKTPSNQVAKKEVITLACMYLDYNVRAQVVDFNKNNGKYRIEVQDYSEYNDYSSEDEADWNAGATKLRTEILSGKVPDLISLNGLSVSQFASKGLLADLYPFLDSDPELDRSQLVENVMKAYETDGKLYTTLSNFTINAVMGASSLVGDTPGWTVDQFQSALAQMRQMNPECTAFDKYVTRADILQQCLYQDMERFVNWETGECNFDSEAFIKLLEFANSFPSSFDWENYEWTEEDDSYYRVSHGSQMLVNMGLYGFNDIYELRIYNKIFGGKGTFIGMPTEFGSGNTFNTAGNQFAMSNKCANKDAAWEFLRQFFTEKYQTNGDLWGFPTNIKAFQAQMDQAMEVQYQTDMNGNYLLDEEGKKIPVDYGTWGSEGFEVPGGPVTQEEVDQIRALIDSTTKVLAYDENIYNIVQEGIEPYFEGQRSAQDVAKQIQSKIMIYVNEQR